MPRFVILRHELSASSQLAARALAPSGQAVHWDLMFEDQGSLLTWALDQEPRLDSSTPAVRLPDHRDHYLDYEGPISEDRGTVHRWDAGEYEFQCRTEDELIATVAGTKIRAQVTLRSAQPDHYRWVVTFSPESAAAGR